MKGKDVFEKPQVLVQNPNHTLTLVDVAEVEIEGPTQFLRYLGHCVVDGREEYCAALAQKLNAVSEQNLGATFLLPEEVNGYFVSEFGPSVLKALKAKKDLCNPWKESLEELSVRLKTPSLWEGLEGFLAFDNN